MEYTDADFPHKKELTGDRFAYVQWLFGHRGRINVTKNEHPESVADFY